MKTEDFTVDARIVNIIDDLKQYFSDNPFIISDVVDDEGHQYVDLVQEGGGVLGIALLGYTHVMEQMGIRFLNIGGTSAGAINSLLIAACDTPEKEKTTRIIDILANKDLFDFIDGDSDAQDFINTLISDKVGILKLLFKGSQVIDNFKNGMGLNPGDNFHQWLVHVLNEFGIYDTAGLLKRMNQLPQSIGYRKNPKGFTQFNDRPIKSDLAIIAAEVNTETKVVFPAMRNLFYKNSDQPNPADYVRASMSIPLFFKPFEINNLPNGEDIIKDWKRIAQHRGGVPQKAVFVDGGIMSNFPIDVFHRHGGIPSRPTFGVKLGLERVTNNNVVSITDLMYGCFDAARNLRDFEFINKNPDFKNLVTCIDIKDHNWLDFNITDKKKVDLFFQGALAAKQFLQNFDWKDYKKIRKSLRGTVNTPEIFEGLSLSLEEIISDKKQQVSSGDIKALEERLFYLGETIDIKALWIDDNPDLVKKERLLLNKLGVKTTIVTSTDDAKDFVKHNPDEIDLIISDVSRDENFSEGIEFTKWLYNVSPGFNRKVIFYIMDLDYSRGVPPYAFGITNSSVELVHLVLDLAQRQD